MNKAIYQEHADALFKMLHTFHLFLLIKLRTTIFMYKIYYSKMPLYILDYFTHSNNVHDTRYISIKTQTCFYVHISGFINAKLPQL